MSRQGFAIYITTVCDGPVPAELGADENPVVYATRLEAERIITEDTIARLQEFLDGQRDFEDAMTVEEYVVEVDVEPDGSTWDEGGRHFGRCES